MPLIRADRVRSARAASTAPAASGRSGVRASVALAILLAVTLCAACSSAGAGSGTLAPGATSESVTSEPAASDPASTEPATDQPATSEPASAAPTAAPTAQASDPQAPTTAGDRTLCGTATTTAAITACLRTSISDFWSGELNNVIDQPVHLAATAAQVPASCRPGIAAAPAFTCRANKQLYINRGLLDMISKDIPPADAFYAFASVQAHEFGHVLQLTLHQPQIENGDDSNANSQYIEQQADCLSGVWAAHADGGFDRATFRRTAVELVTLVSSNAEIATHGTPAQRAAAIDRGLASGRPQACALATFR